MSTEDLDEKAKRVRSLLSSFYGSGEAKPDASGGTTVYAPNGLPVSPAKRDTLVTINTKEFDLDRYMASLIRRTSLDGLLHKHVEMAAEIKNLDSDMQMLVYENYNKFISATDTIRSMKENVTGMESNMDHLLETVTAVRSKSDGINASLFERRGRIEELNGTRSLLRKVQFVFDLPKRMRKSVKDENYADAVTVYLGAAPVLKAYGTTSFKACKEEAEEIMALIKNKLQAQLKSENVSLEIRAQAAALLQKLDFSITKLMEDFLSVHWPRLMAEVQVAVSKSTAESQKARDAKATIDEPVQSPKAMLEHLNKDFIADFSTTATAFRAIFPTEEKRLTEAATKLFNEWVLSSNSHGRNHPAVHILSLVKFVVGKHSFLQANTAITLSEILSSDVGKMHELVPAAGLANHAARAVEAAVKQHVALLFVGLNQRISGAIASIPLSSIVDKQKPLQIALVNIENVVMEGSLRILKDLKELLQNSGELLSKWKDVYIDLVQSGFQDLFTSLVDHFFAFCTTTGTEKLDNSSEKPHFGSSTAMSPGLVLILACLSIYIEQTAVPNITEVIASSFTGGGARGYEERPAFVPSEICRAFRSTGERLLNKYIDIQARKLSVLVRKSVATPNWLKYKEPRDVRMFVDLVLHELEALEEEVQQILEPGTARTHRRTDSTGSAGSSRSGPPREERLSREKGSSRARSRLLERDVAKLFTQRVDLFTKPDYTQASVIATVVKMGLKSFQEYVRLQTFSRSGYQQIQVDTQYLRDPLQAYVDEDTVVNFLLDEVCSAAAERSIDPIPLEPAILDKLIQAKRAKTAVKRLSVSPLH